MNHNLGDLKMKRIIFALTFFFAATIAYAQTSPETYLAQLPAAPKSGCNLKAAEKATYVKSVRGLKEKMDKDIMKRKEESQVYADANRDKVVAGVTAYSGPVEKITGKSGRMTKEERKAASEQMMRQQGVSPEETKKLKSMSKEEKTAWALSRSGKAADKMQADPKFQDTGAQAKSIYDLQVEQKALLERIDSRRAGVISRLKALDQNAAAMKAKEIDPLDRQLSSMGGLVVSKEQSDRVDQVAMKLKDAQKRYCETYAPQYHNLLNEYLSAVKASLPDYRRLEEIVAKTQFGLDKPIDANAGLLGIEAVNDYAAMLASVFKYDLTN